MPDSVAVVACIRTDCLAFSQIKISFSSASNVTIGTLLKKTDQKQTRHTCANTIFIIDKMAKSQLQPPLRLTKCVALATERAHRTRKLGVE